MSFYIESLIIGIGLLVFIDFVLIDFMVFLIIKIFNKARELTELKLLKKTEEIEEAPAEPEVKAPTTEELLADILAELKKGNE
jgi:large-conductance mechanosensitive channel